MQEWPRKPEMEKKQQMERYIVKWKSNAEKTVIIWDAAVCYEGAPFDMMDLWTLMIINGH